MTPDAYRGIPATCPACSTPMELRRAGDAEIDVCPGCHGLWLDWFDGETVSLVELAMPLSRRASGSMPEAPSCPRCRVSLEAALHDTSDVVVWRCGECAGTFMPRATAEALLVWAATHPTFEDPLDRLRAIIDGSATIAKV